MKKLFYKTEKELALDLVNKYIEKKENNDDYLLAVIGDYDTLLPVFNEFVYADCKLVFSEFGDSLWNGYEYSYVLSVYNNEISIEKTYNVDKKRYISVEADEVYIITPTEYPASRANVISDGLVYDVSIHTESEGNEKTCKCDGNHKCNKSDCKSKDDLYSGYSFDELLDVYLNDSFNRLGSELFPLMFGKRISSTKL